MKTDLIWHTGLPATLPLSTAGRTLLHTQSLTLGLQRLSAEFSVRLLHLGEGESGIWLPHLAGGGFCRDVLLCLNQQPVVWARSLCSRHDANWLPLLDCGTQPLGKRLFDGSLPLIRSPFEYTLATAEHPLPGFNAHAFAARRSRFMLRQSPLDLVECFLPALHDFLA